MRYYVLVEGNSRAKQRGSSSVTQSQRMRHSVILRKMPKCDMTWKVGLSFLGRTLSCFIWYDAI